MVLKPQASDKSGLGIHHRGAVGWVQLTASHMHHATRDRISDCCAVV